MHAPTPATSAALRDPTTHSASVAGSRVAHRQRARVAAGIAMCVGALAMGINALGQTHDTWDGVPIDDDTMLAVHPEVVHQAVLLLAVWLTSAAVYVLVRGVLRLTRPDDVVERRTSGLSLALPLIGASFLLPLTLHAVVGTLWGVAASGYDGWVKMSLVVVGHAHVVLALFAGRAGWCMGAGVADGTVHETSSPWAALGWTTVASSVPGAILLMVPPMVTFATGLVFVPPMFLWARAMAEREVGIVGALPTALPRVRAVTTSL